MRASDDSDHYSLSGQDKNSGVHSFVYPAIALRIALRQLVDFYIGIQAHSVQARTPM
jgi:hypothetical protein